MHHYLAKTEPSTYSIDDLARDQHTVWDGVTNPQAVKSILAMRKGDKVLIYHSGGVSAIVGIASVRSDGKPDPKNPKSAVAELGFVSKLDTPIPLAEIKGTHLLTTGPWCAKDAYQPWRSLRRFSGGCGSITPRRVFDQRTLSTTSRFTRHPLPSPRYSRPACSRVSSPATPKHPIPSPNGQKTMRRNKTK